MDPAHLLRTARRQAGLSQRQMAARSGVAASTVADVERGAVRPSLQVLDRLLDAAGLEVTLDRRLPAPCPHLVRYLRLPLATRL
ncbi:MAG TPA: helix-turn-helix transcriptional regulator [Mycobacteriales bacterium]|nr:helix-turn-helix transcriptional regulator [Mycobacteriales bacterium]